MVCGDIESNPGPPPTPELQEILDNTLKEQTEMRENMNAHFNELISEISTIKSSISALTSDVTELKDRLDIQRVDIDAEHENVLKIEDRLNTVEENIEKLDQYSRRENVIIYGLTDSSDETPDSCRNKVLECFNANTRNETLFAYTDWVGSQRAMVNHVNHVQLLFV